MVGLEYAGEFFRRVKLGFEVEAVPRAELMQILGQIMMARAPLVLARRASLRRRRRVAEPAARSRCRS